MKKNKLEILDLKIWKVKWKSSLETFKIRFELTKESISISKLENRSIEIMKSEEKRKNNE